MELNDNYGIDIIGIGIGIGIAVLIRCILYKYYGHLIKNRS